MSKGSDNLTKQVFVAYAYNLYDTRDYRKVFASLEKSFGIKFVFADEKITNMHILQKIISYIRGSDFALFDISAWNPNVTLELGIALAMSEDWYICFNPDKMLKRCLATYAALIEFSTQVLASLRTNCRSCLTNGTRAARAQLLTTTLPKQLPMCMTCYRRSLAYA